MVPAEKGKVPGGRLQSLLKASPKELLWDFPSQARAQGDDSFMVLFQYAEIYSGAVIKPIREASGDDLHQVAVSQVVFGEQDQMAVLSVPAAFVLHSRGGNIDLAADDRMDAYAFCVFVKFHDAVHGAVVGNGSTGHAQFLHPVKVVPDAVGAVEQAVCRMCMEVHKC